MSQILDALRIKYGDSLSMDHIKNLESNKLSIEEKEKIRKIKISIANKGRKPWNLGKQHRPDTLERIRERTRIAMYRSDVRQRWVANWVPKAHTMETKKKLRLIMLKKESVKLEKMPIWLYAYFGIDLETYEDLSSRYQDFYRRFFNSKWRMGHFTSLLLKKTEISILHQSKIQILSLYALEADRKNSKEEKENIKTPYEYQKPRPEQKARSVKQKHDNDKIQNYSGCRNKSCKNIERTVIKNKILSPFDLKLLFIYLLITLIQDTKPYTAYGDQISLNQTKSELLTEEKTFYDISDVTTGLFRIEGFEEKLQNHVQICWITLLEALD